ncbi:MAG: hypothetical protein K2G94_07835 [Muribaculaceae bacterium]|nr:hypothetical protein [Muribaculaceae bacterium]
MVNRVLIRLKVVQALYGYLLTRSEFKIEAPVETSSHDRRYSYSAYADMLLMMLEMSGWKVQADRSLPPSVTASVVNAPYADSATARFLMGNDEVRELIRTRGSRMAEFDSAVIELAQRIKASSPYREFLKIRKPEVSDEIAFWTQVLRLVAPKTPALVDAMRTDPEFTVRGMEMGLKMLADTLSNYSDTRNVLADCRRDLTRSLDKAYELYVALLLLPVEITHAQSLRIEAAREKYLPTPEERNPDMRFVNNAYVAAASSSDAIEEFTKKTPVLWDDEPGFISQLLDLVTDSDAYKAYMATPGEKTLAEDCDLWRTLIKNVIVPSDVFSEYLESKSIFWNDDLDVMASFAIKTIRTFAASEAHSDIELLPKFKDDEDSGFGMQLFNNAVAHRVEYREWIDVFINTKRWDVDRVALMDVVILLTALSEVMSCPSIPLTVTANEYVEIANRYSNPRSGSFINGMLAAITDKLRADGLLHKDWK